jgi:hypothetical protein
MIHPAPHPLAGQTASLASGAQVEIEDWADRVIGEPWQTAMIPVAFAYAGRVADQNLPLDSEVVYAKDRAHSAHLIHVTELATSGEGL